MKLRKLFFLFFLLVICSLIKFPPDSDWWISHSQQFLNALLKADFRGSSLDFEAQLHPGLSVEWISALIQFLLPLKLHHLVLHLGTLGFSFLISLHNLVFSTLLVISFCLGFSILSKYFSRESIKLSIIYIVLLPNLILVSGSTYLDWILSGLLFLCSALWMDYLNSGKMSSIFWVGSLTGLAILTKYSAVLILPAFFATALIKNFSLKSLIKSLSFILLLALAVFVIFYPAMWADPGQVLFSLFGKKESIYGFSMGASSTKEISEKFLSLSIKLNPMLFLGSALTLICLFTKHTKKEALIPGIFGLIYLVILVLLVYFISYSGSALVFVNQFDRYTLPAIVLFTVTFFELIYQNPTLKKFYLFRNALILLLFLSEIVKVVVFTILNSRI